MKVRVYLFKIGGMTFKWYVEFNDEMCHTIQQKSQKH